MFSVAADDIFLKKEISRYVFIIKDALSLNSLNLEYKKVILELLKFLEIQMLDLEESVFKITLYEANETLRLKDNQIIEYLFHRYRYLVYPKIKKIDNYPPCLQVELSSICNYKCVFCYQADRTFTDSANGYMGRMNFELFKKIVDQIEGNIQFITFASRGEPLLVKNLDSILKYTKGKFLTVKINTNAYYLTESVCHSILSSDISTIVFSLDSSDAKLYEELRVNGKLDRVVNNIKAFNKIKELHYPEAKIITRISGVLYDSKKQDMNLIKKKWANLAEQITFVPCTPWFNMYNALKNEITTPCTDLWRRMFIWYDGSVGICDCDYKIKYEVGSVNENNISLLWLSKKYRKIRNLHLNGQRNNENPCDRCICY
jgi:radical SAM protein with 4Fe4S-binding SPASM domain